MSTNDGKALEELVKKFEEHLSPAGWTVSLRPKPRDEYGKQLAEFDITVKGPIGSSSVKWLIECRGRKRPVSSSWIEQLYGRKARFGFNRVFAVSTSGFSPSAIDASRTLDITRREIHHISEIANDYQVKDVTCVLTDIREPDIVYYRDPQTNEMASANTEDMQLKKPGDSAFRPLSNHLFESIQNISHPKQEHPVWKVGWDFEGPVQFLLGDGTVVEAESPHATFIATISVNSLQAVTSRVYEEEGRVIGAEAIIEIDSEGFKAVVLCSLSYDQTNDTWLVTSLQTEGPSKWISAPGPIRVPGSTLKTTFEASPKARP